LLLLEQTLDRKFFVRTLERGIQFGFDSSFEIKFRRRLFCKAHSYESESLCNGTQITQQKAYVMLCLCLLLTVDAARRRRRRRGAKSSFQKGSDECIEVIFGRAMIGLLGHGSELASSLPKSFAGSGVHEASHFALDLVAPDEARLGVLVELEPDLPQVDDGPANGKGFKGREGGA
jgi:hypothetical protein